MPGAPSATPSPELQSALALLRQGRHAEAEQACRVALAAGADGFGARHLLGIVLLLRGDATAALQQFSDAISIDPTVPAAHYNLGNAFSALDRRAEALVAYDRALALAPGMAEAWFNRGNALAALGRLQDAAASFREAVRLRPGLADAHNNLGHALLGLGDADSALAAFDAALGLRPDHAGALNNRGSALLALGRPGEALASFDRAIAIAPGFAQAHDNRGTTLQALGRPAEAVASHDRAVQLQPESSHALRERANARRQLGQHQAALADCERAIALAPDSAEALNTRGVVLHDMGRYPEALADYDRALALKPGFAEAWNNRGNVLHDLGRGEEALASLQRALELKPGYVEALDNLGMVLQDLKRFDEAAVVYDRAIEHGPTHAEAHKRRATLRLLRGDFARGMADYEASHRHARVASGRRPVARAHWEGQPLQGRSLLLSEPSGFGDTLQFWRFIPQLLAMGAQVGFFGQPRLYRLLRSSPWPVRLLSAPPAAGAFDYECELWSLPHVLGTTLDTLPGGVPYFAAEPALAEKWAAWLGHGHYNIGIAWQGKPDRKIDAGRSIPLATFRPLAGVPGVRLVSLQQGHGTEQLQALAEGMAVRVPGADFDAGADAFVDTAALMASLDLVVTSDTAIAHLAGALGRPTWVALKHVPEWRWMLDRDDSPWYPTMRLFRQQRAGEWGGVFEAMAAVLGQRQGRDA